MEKTNTKKKASGLPQFNKDCYQSSVPSTLCVGCGHDQISKAIIKAAFEEQIEPTKIAKISGIGCSSKTPNYFLKMSQGFNTIHGRMASVATGIKIANSSLKVIGVSGDGDTGSIGLSSFLHTVRKNIPMVYIVENNGVYGLTKGQFSVTAKKDSQIKYHKTNPFTEMDLCRLTLESGCGFVARCFSGDSKQLVTILKMALRYKGFAFIDIISPCVAYGNQEEFPYSFSSMKKNRIAINELDIIEPSQPICIDLKEGEKEKIELSDGSHITIKKIEKDHDPQDFTKASNTLRKHSNKNQIATGLFYYQEKDLFFDNCFKKPLISYPTNDIVPTGSDLKNILNLFK